MENITDNDINFHKDSVRLIPVILKGSKAFREFVTAYEKYYPELKQRDKILDEYNRSKKSSEYFEKQLESSLRFLDIHDPDLPPVSLADCIYSPKQEPLPATTWQKIKKTLRLK